MAFSLDGGARQAGVALAIAAMALGGACGAADAKQTVKICAIQPTSGPNAAIGIGLMNSMELAVNRINASGKLEDIELQLVKLDDQSQPSQGVNAALKAASDQGVLACASHFNSPVALATNDVFHRNGLANVVPAAINWKITVEQKGDEIFRIAAPDVWQLEMGAKFPFKEAGKKTFFLIDDNTSYGKSLVESFQKFATAAGGEFIGGDSIAVGEKDFTAVLTKAKEAKPDVVFFGGITNEAALLRQQMVKLDFKTFYYTGSGVMTPTYVDISGPAAEGTYAFFYGIPYDQTPGGPSFIAAYKEARFDKPYESYGLAGYSAVEVLAQAIVGAQKAGALNRRGVIDQLKSSTFETALGPVSFPKPGDAKQRVLAYYQVQNGKWTLTHTSDPDGNIQPAKKAVWELPWK